MPITIDALGTVTPLATVTIRTQISGKLMSVGFQGRPTRQGRRFPRPDRSPPYQAALAQAQGQLAKDTALMQQAQADLARYQTLNRQDSIAKQQVDDQVFLVAQDKAAMATDQAQIDAANLNIGYTQHRFADQRPRRPAARRSRQLRAGDRRQRDRRRHPTRPDQRRVLDAGGQPAAHQRAAEGGRASCRSRPSTAPTSSSWRSAS